MTTTTDEPIATYRERLLEVRRDFLLYRDRMVVRARWLHKGRFETAVPLRTLSRHARPIVIRYRLFRIAGWITALSLLTFSVVFYGAKGSPLGGGGYIALGASLLGLCLVAATYPNRRIHFVRFDSKSGRGGLDIGMAGNSAETFNAFVDKTKRQIAQST